MAGSNMIDISKDITVPNGVGVIYSIFNIANNKRYIGSTTRLTNRKNAHFYHLRCGNHYNTHLQNAWDNYGEDSFTFLILEQVLDISTLQKREGYWQNVFNVLDPEKGYNNREEIDSAVYKYTEAARKNMSVAAKLRPPITEKTRRKLSEAGKRKRITLEYRQKLSKANKGKIRTEEQRRANSEAKMGNKNPNYGKQRTEEFKKAVSMALKGRKKTPEHLAKILEGRRRFYSEQRALQNK